MKDICVLFDFWKVKLKKSLHNRHRLVFCGILICDVLFATYRTIAGSTILPSEVEHVLDGYVGMQASFRQCISITNYTTFIKDPAQIIVGVSEYRCDGIRARATEAERQWPLGDPVPSELPPAKKDEPPTFTVEDSVSTDDGVLCYSNFSKMDSENFAIVDHLNPNPGLALPLYARQDGWFRGWDIFAPHRMDDLLRLAPSLTFHQDVVDGHECEFVRGGTDSGDYSVWFDIGRGNNILQFHIVRSANSRDWKGDPLWKTLRFLSRSRRVPYDKNDAQTAQIVDGKNITLSNVSGIWLPTQMTVVSTTTSRDGLIFRVETQLRRTHIDLAPTFPADSFVLNIPNGTQAVIRANDQADNVPRVWHNGMPLADVDAGALSALDHSLDNERLIDSQRSASGPSWKLACVTTIAIVIVLGGAVAAFLKLKRSRA